MILWRLAGEPHAMRFDGGYGLLFDGRWNSLGHAVTYCATSPALCVLEKLVHVEDPARMPELVMVTYEVPDEIAMQEIGLADLPDDWRHREGLTQQMGDDWHERAEQPLLAVPSVLLPLKNTPDLNVVINNAHPDAARIRCIGVQDYRLDPRLL